MHPQMHNPPYQLRMPFGSTTPHRFSTLGRSSNVLHKIVHPAATNSTKAK
jgi:hypothetical protein